MKTIAIIAAGILIHLSFPGIVVGEFPSPEYKQRVRKMKAEQQRRVDEMMARHNRRAAEMNADFERRQGESQQAFVDRVNREMKDRHDRFGAEFDDKLQYRENILALPRDPPPFDPATAPPPQSCLKAYIAAVTKADKLADIYNYLPRAQRPTINHSLKGTVWEKTVAADDDANRFDLEFRKAFATSIVDVLSVQVDGNKAVLMVSTNSGGAESPRGRARIEMIGENKYWKVQRCKDTF